MRRRALRFSILLVVTSAFGYLFWHTVPGDWKASSQGSNVIVAPVYATYQFNTLKHPTGLLMIQGYLYIADSGNNVIRRFFLNNLETVAGTGTAGFVNGHRVTTAQFNNPTGLAGSYRTFVFLDPNTYTYRQSYQHDIYINDAQNHAVRKACVPAGIPPMSGPVPPCDTVSTLAGNGTDGLVDGYGSSARFSYLGGMTLESTGMCYMGDAGNHVIRTWDGAHVGTYAGTGSYGYVNGYRTSAKFNAPTKTTKDNAGNMYVADAGNHVIRKIDSAGNVTTLAGTGQRGYVNGAGSAAKFSEPSSVVFNPADNMLYVADRMNNTIRRVDLAGNVTTYAGATTGGLVNGSRTAARFSGPVDLVINGGFMYISDSMNNVIRRIDMGAGQVTTYIS
jgi:hypothetical protein